MVLKPIFNPIDFINITSRKTINWLFSILDILDIPYIAIFDIPKKQMVIPVKFVL